MTEIATIDWFGGGGHLFSLKKLLYLIFSASLVPINMQRVLVPINIPCVADTN